MKIRNIILKVDICIKLAYTLPLQMACQDIIAIQPLISWGDGGGGGG